MTKVGRWGGRARDEVDPKSGRELRSNVTPEEKARLAKFGSVSPGKSQSRDPNRMQKIEKFSGVGPKGKPA